MLPSGRLPRLVGSTVTVRSLSSRARRRPSSSPSERSGVVPYQMSATWGWPASPINGLAVAAAGEGVFDVGQSGAEFVGAGAELGKGDGAVGEGGGQVGEALADGGGLGVQCGGVHVGIGRRGEHIGGVGALQAGHDDPLDIVVQLLRGAGDVPALAGVVPGLAPVSGLPFPASGLGHP